MDRKPCSVHVVADQDCHFLVVDEDRLLALINTSSAIARNFLFILMHYLRNKDSTAPEHSRLQQKYQRESSVDELTGLHNRRWLDDMLTRQIMRCATNKQPLSIIMVDVDNLSEFNNEFGVNAGDQALYSVAQTIMTNARPTDIIARYGGDRFAIVLPGTDTKGAELVGERLRTAISETKIVIPRECILPPVSVSLGISQLKAFVAAEKFLSDAVAALECARDDGGNEAVEQLTAQVP